MKVATFVLPNKEVTTKSKHDLDNILETPYEKVMKILNKVTKYMINQKEIELSKQIQYVIYHIEGRSLYSYSPNADLGLKTEKEKEEVKLMLDSLNEYSEPASFLKQTNTRRKSIFIQAAEVNKGDIKRPTGRFKTVISNINNESRNNGFMKKITEKISELSEVEQLNTPISQNSRMLEYSNHFDEIGCHIDYESRYSQVFTKDFSILDFYDQYKAESYCLLGRIIYKDLDLVPLIDSTKLNNFLNAIRKGYNEAPHYHNEMHSIDVCHTIFSYITHAYNFEDLLKFTKLEVLALITAAICHDIGHPGFNNNFHINSLSSFAVTYNDKSVLESYHASESTRILLISENNILGKLEKVEFKNFRRHFIDSILSTDMMFHTRINSVIKSKLGSLGIIKGTNLYKLVPDDESQAFEVHQEILNFLLHTADISHNSKKFSISYKWTLRLYDEFWNQGDTEKKSDLPISFLCDRSSADIPKAQIGFIKGIIQPSFEILIDMFPSLDYLMDNINSNLEEWSKLVEQKEVVSKAMQDLVGSTKSKTSKKITFNTHFTVINLDESIEN